MLGSANFTEAGIRHRAEVSVLVQGEGQVQELAGWFDAQWRTAYMLDDGLLSRIDAFVAKLPIEPVAERMRPPEIAPILSPRAAALVPLIKEAPRGRDGSSSSDFYFNYGHAEGCCRGE